MLLKQTLFSENTVPNKKRPRGATDIRYHETLREARTGRSQSDRPVLALSSIYTEKD